MIWWAKTQRLAVIVAVSLLAALLGGVAVGGISFPALSGIPFAEVPYFALTPLIACATLAATTSRAATTIVTTATRRIAPRGLALALLPIAAAAAIGAASAPSGQASTWLPIRVTAGDIGLQLLIGALLGSRFQALGPALALLVAALFGRDGSAPARWAWPIDQRTDLAAWAIPVALLLVGAVAHLALVNRRTLRSAESEKDDGP